MSAWTPYFRQRVALDAYRRGLSSRPPSLADCPYITLHPSQLVRAIDPGDTVCWLHTLRSGLQVPVLAEVVSFEKRTVKIRVTKVDGEVVERNVLIGSLRAMPQEKAA